MFTFKNLLLLSFVFLFFSTVQAQGACKNLRNDCDNFARNGYCTGPFYRQFMRLNCPLACALCQGGVNPNPNLTQTCPTIVIANGQFDCSNGVNIGSSCSFDCDDRFGLSHDQPSNCTNENNQVQWRPSIPSCIRCGGWREVIACSVTCGEGTRTEERSCSGNTESRETKCDQGACIGPEWSPWQDSGSCSVTCGGGKQRQTRTCNNGPGCIGPTSQRVDCNTQDCSDGNTFGPWSTCSSDCGRGVQTRSRSCGNQCTELQDQECVNGADCQCSSCTCEDTQAFCSQIETNSIWCQRYAFYQSTCPKTCARCPPCANCAPTYDDWSTWSECSVSCGGGSQFRYRDCNKIAGCNGLYKEARNCGTESCQPGNPEWTSWKDSGSCSVTCGGGKQRQTRTCNNGSGCVGPTSQSVDCNTDTCPPDPEWSSWNDSGSCSVTCGGGKQRQTRTCNNGPGCVGSTSQSVDCNTEACPPDPEWTSWKNAGSCSVTCGGGKQRQTRTCNNGPGCVGPTTQRVDCNNGTCPPDPEWTSWKNTGSCSVTCGGGKQRQTRTCNNGPGCVGPTSQRVDCNTGTCPPDPEWTSWKNAGSCSVTCGGGKQRQTRTCNNGPGCVGPTSQRVNCNTGTCPPDPEWTSWKNAGSCSVTCGGGKQRQTRTCNNGPGCVGPTSQRVDCNTGTCPPGPVGPVEWSDWSQYSSCPVTCGRGVQVRIRTCPRANACAGKAQQERTCTVSTVCPCTCPCEDPQVYAAFCQNNASPQFCPTIKHFCPKSCNSCNQQCNCGTWSAWRESECSTTCGPGTLFRTRTCPVNSVCDGDASDTSPCNVRSCDGIWSIWSECTKTCGGGMQTRMRSCPPGSSCAGEPTSEDKVCNSASCGESWGTWRGWERCSISCGPGIQRRRRVCRGTSCPGRSTMQRACNIRRCPVNFFWSECSRSCGNGTQFKRTAGGGMEFRDCLTGACSKDTCESSFRERYTDRFHECCYRPPTRTVASCGLNTAIRARVIGGQNALIKQWPWMVIIYPKPDRLCGGTLIRDDLVLTAAHCMVNLPASGVRMVFGSLAFRDNSRHVQTGEAAEVIIHPQYDFPKNDIAIIKLKTPVPLHRDYIRTICLPQGEQVPDDLFCRAAGWGSTSVGGGAASTLQEVGLRTLPFGVCQNAYKSTNDSGALRDDYMLCAGRIAGQIDTCTGDSGGPLMCQRCSSCAWMVVGVTSFGSPRCARAGLPGVYTRVSFYESWINRVTNSNIASGNFASCT